MTEMNERTLRALVAEEADKQPLRVQVVRREPDTAERVAMSIFNLLLAGLLLMWGLRAANEWFEVVPAGGYVNCVMVILGLNALGAALGWARCGIVR